MKTAIAFLFLGFVSLISADSSTLRGGEKEQFVEENGEVESQSNEIFVPAAKIDEFEMTFVEPLNEEMALHDHGRHLYGGGYGYGRYCFRAGRFGGYVAGGGYGHYYRKMEVNDEELVPLETSIAAGAKEAGLEVEEERKLDYHRKRVCFRFRFLICCRREHYGYGHGGY
uniref:Uncharacterized protein n=1 Tax=Leptocylindrus danicus TaxID=163516 RepID=A0A7S2KC14_9STRA